MKKSVALAILAAAMATPAFAADNGLYIGANLGNAAISGANFGGLTKTSDTSMSFLGGYQVNKNLAVEVQYIDFGKIYAQASHPITTTGTSLSVIGILPVGESFAVLGKFGMASTKLKVSCDTCTPPNYRSTRSAAVFGLGGQYNLNQSIGIRVGYEAYAVGNVSDQTDGNYRVVSAGVVYKF